MLRKLACLLFMMSLALPALAAEKAGSISGYVRNAEGIPQMGAMVEVLGSVLHTFRVFTDEKGFYSAPNILPGTYNVKVSAPSFLTTLRERVGVHAGTALTVNITLTTLFDALQLAPAGTTGEDEDWKWVLRSVSNRPILRLREDGTAIFAADSENRELRGTLSFLAGSPSTGYGSTSDMSTAFSVEKSIFSSGTVGLRGNVGYGSGSPATVLRASYKHTMDNGSEPAVAFTMRRLAAPDLGLRSAALQALSLTTSDNLVLGDILELRFGSELQTIQFMGRLNAFRPFASAGLHLSPNTLVEYRYTTIRPDGRMEKGFDSAPADLSESGPLVSMVGFRSSIERSRHHEVSVSRHAGKNTLQLAAYTDRIIDPALTGVGEVSSDGGYALPDLYSGTFSYRGKDMNARGMRLVLQRNLTPDLTASVDYEFGGALGLEQNGVDLKEARSLMNVSDHHSVAAKVSGSVPVSKTRWIASYRWTGGPVLTPVDMFSVSPGQADPFLNIFLRQPIPGTSFLPGRMEALIDLHNLLAQGYIPVLGQDGRTLYLVQSARTVRGGVEFTF